MKFVKLLSLLTVILFLGCGGEQTKVDVNYNTDKDDNLDELVATAQSIILNESTTKLITLSGNRNNLFYNIKTQPSHGTLRKIENNIFKYSANVGFKGVDSFSFTVNDGSNSSKPATVKITVNNSVQDQLTCKLLPKTGQTTTYHNNDDGDLKKGATRSYK